MATQTSQVYVIDEIVQRSSGDEEICIQILSSLSIGKDAFRRVQRIASMPGCSLRQIREETALKYNQIRAVIASMINGIEL